MYDFFNLKSMKIGLLSDTHGWIHPRLFDLFDKCDEIWHAGDIGNIETADTIASYRLLRAVYGNIDDSIVRSVYRESLRFEIEGKEILMTHNGGRPGHYSLKVREEIKNFTPEILICGHSHIAMVMYDRKAGMLYINPGAAGYTGFHKYMTVIRFNIDYSGIHNLELVELGERGKVIL